MSSFTDAVPSIEVQRDILAPHVGFTSVSWRPDTCRHLRVVAGRCPSGPRDLLVNVATARSVGFRVGTRLAIGEERTPRTIVGLYQPPRDDPYWFGNVYFTDEGVRTGVGDTAGLFDAMFVTRGAVTGLPNGTRTTLRVAFGANADRLSRADVHRIDAVVAAETAWGRRIGATVGTPIYTPLRAADHSSRLLSRNSLVFLLELLFGIGVLLFAAVDDVVTARSMS